MDNIVEKEAVVAADNFVVETTVNYPAVENDLKKVVV